MPPGVSHTDVGAPRVASHPPVSRPARMRPPRPPVTFAALVALALLTAPAADAQVTPGGSGTVRPRGGAGRPVPGPIDPRQPLRDSIAFGPSRPGPAGAGLTPAAVPRTSGTRQPLPGERLACRNAPWPRGWIAAAYVADGGQCPGSAGGAAAAAVLVRFDRQPLYGQLEVCADQPTPINWQVVDEPVEDASARCPGAARGDTPAMKRIRRTQ